MISLFIYSYLYKFETTDYGEESQIKEKIRDVCAFICWQAMAGMNQV